MPIDDLYKKFKEPTPDSLPRFEEESWRKMEQLLDKHLPEKGGKKFPYFILLGCFSLVFLTTFLPAKQQRHTATAAISNPQLAQITEQQTVLTTEPVNSNQQKTVKEEELLSNNVPVVTDEHLPKAGLHLFTAIQSRKPAQQQISSSVTPQPAEEEQAHAIGYTDRSFLFGNRQQPFVLGKPMNNIVLQTSNATTAPVVKPVKNSLSFTVSAGLEAPGFQFSRWGKITPSIGAGLQYSFRNKIIVSAGIAQSTKIYTAQDKDYHATGYWYNYTTFKRIDADCKIIEIPVSAAYRVVNGKRTSMFVSAGSSSYIMRKETYAYDYKNQYGNDTVVTRTYSTNGSHLFSSINLSVIAERKLTNRFSIMAEPIVKIPTAGIGFGKVRLYNAGINVTAKFKLR
ncbi:MAG: hypothetical protein GXC73_03905 [Chitinophagaceae bacterium]|nr:hypothetical protein [Chitinophagaceae bacterium]